MNHRDHHDEHEQRVCPGRHTGTDAAPALRDDEHLCRSCVDRTFRYVRHLADDLAELEVTIARRAATRYGGSARRREGEDAPPPEVDGLVLSREKRLPFNDAAAAVRVDVEQRIIEWAEFIAEDLGVDMARKSARRPGHSEPAAPVRPRPPADPRCRHDMVEGTCAICRDMGDVDEQLLYIVHPERPPLPKHRRPAPRRVFAAIAVLRSAKARNWMRVDEQGPAYADAIAYIRSRARASVDRFDRRWYAGPCGLPTEVVDLVEDDGKLKPVVRTTTCAADLYAAPGAAVVVCDGYREPGGIGGCGQMHPAVTRHKWVVQTVRERWLPLAALLSVVPQLTGREPSVDQVRQWRQRGKLTPVVCLTKHETDDELEACRLHRGELFRGGQLLDLVTDDTADRRRRPLHLRSAPCRKRNHPRCDGVGCECGCHDTPSNSTRTR